MGIVHCTKFENYSLQTPAKFHYVDIRTSKKWTTYYKARDNPDAPAFTLLQRYRITAARWTKRCHVHSEGCRSWVQTMRLTSIFDQYFSSYGERRKNAPNKKSSVRVSKIRQKKEVIDESTVEVDERSECWTYRATKNMRQEPKSV